MKFPWMQFYPGDWLKDECVALCKPSTRGIWIDMLLAMHNSDRSGVIAGTRDQLAQLCRCSAVELDLAIAELNATKTADVTLRNSVVTVVNRRMKREAKLREQTRLRVKRARHKGECNADTPPIRHRSDVISQRSDIKRLNGAKSHASGSENPRKESSVNRSPINRSNENELMGQLRLLVGTDEMASNGGHWRVDHVRKHPALLQRCIDEVQRMKKEGETFTNSAAACLEDLVKRWKT